MLGEEEDRGGGGGIRNRWCDDENDRCKRVVQKQPYLLLVETNMVWMMMMML
jgi:hypothetical protein